MSTELEWTLYLKFESHDFSGSVESVTFDEQIHAQGKGLFPSEILRSISFSKISQCGNYIIDTKKIILLKGFVCVTVTIYYILIHN